VQSLAGYQLMIMDLQSNESLPAKKYDRPEGSENQNNGKPGLWYNRQILESMINGSWALSSPDKAQ
jgi:hypothetical protein